MDISFYLSLFAAVVAAGIGVLTVIAPRTKTTVDDSILERLEQLEKLIAADK
jgi:hypothetical protein